MSGTAQDAPTAQDDAYAPTDRTVPTRSARRASYDKEPVHAILDEGYVCHLGFVRDGAPVVLPTLYGRVGERLYVHGSTGSRPLRMTGQADPGLPVCLTVTHVDGLVLARSAFHHSINYRSVVVHGIAHQVTDPEEKRLALDALVDHVVPGRSADSRPANAKELAATAVIRLDLDEVSAQGPHRRGRTTSPRTSRSPTGPAWSRCARATAPRSPTPTWRPAPSSPTTSRPSDPDADPPLGRARATTREWQQWLSAHDFGQLAVNGPPGEPPYVQPLHFAYDAERGEAVTHLARPNPLWPALEMNPSRAAQRGRRLHVRPRTVAGRAGRSVRTRDADELLRGRPTPLHGPHRGRAGGEGRPAQPPGGSLPAGGRLGASGGGRGTLRSAARRYPWHQARSDGRTGEVQVRREEADGGPGPYRVRTGGPGRTTGRGGAGGPAA